MNKVSVEELHGALQPDSLMERFAYRKEANILTKNDFLSMKNVTGQLEIDHNNSKDCNPDIGFKSSGYSVMESAGTVKVVIVKKSKEEFTFGYRTVNGSAHSPKDYTQKTEIVTMTASETEKEIEVAIIDDDQWNEDLTFHIELFKSAEGY